MICNLQQERGQSKHVWMLEVGKFVVGNEHSDGLFSP